MHSTLDHRYGPRMAGRLALTLATTLFAAFGAAAVVDPAVAAPPPPPTVGTPTITPTSASGVAVSVSIDALGTDTTVRVEYVTAGAYRPGSKVPSAAVTVVIGTTPGSGSGPVVITGDVTGLDPATTYRMRVKAENLGGETLGMDVQVRTPKAPKAGFKAKVGPDTTKLTKLTVAGLSGGETAKVTCKSKAKGCPFTAETVGALAAGTAKLSRLLKGFKLAPGAKVKVRVSEDGAKLSTMTLTIRDGEQPKVKRK